MKITEIVVNAGRTFNHPFESYSNLRPAVTITASIDNGDNVDECTKALQARAEKLVEDHKQHLLSSLRRLEELTILEREASSLESNIHERQRRLAHVREQQGAIPEEDRPW